MGSASPSTTSSISSMATISAVSPSFNGVSGDRKPNHKVSPSGAMVAPSTFNEFGTSAPYPSAMARSKWKEPEPSLCSSMASQSSSAWRVRIYDYAMTSSSSQHD